MTLDPRWCETVDDGVANAAWDHYDALLQREVSDYNLRLPALGPDWVPVDWQIAKAMLWVESGGPSSKNWKGLVFQIGSTGNPAYRVVQGLREGAALIVSDSLRVELGNRIDQPQRNIRFGLAYLFTRMAKLGHVSIEDPQAKDAEHIVAPGETMQRLASKLGTTIEVLQRLNPAVKVLHAGQKLRWRPARFGFAVSGWRPFDPATIADRYNGGSDESYAEKLTYVLQLFTKLERTP